MRTGLLIFLLATTTLVASADEVKVGRILVNRKTVFATGTKSDQHFPYSWANKLHILTSESYIRNELLFQEGQPLDDMRIKESERLLRSRPVFRYVKITPQEPVNGVSDVWVETEDVWTTTIRLGYGSAGGINTYTLGFLEHNFLGTGKEIGAFVRKDIDRLLRGMVYKDPQFLGSRWTLSTGYGRDEKGRDWQASLEKPFYSVLVPHSEGVNYAISEDEDRLFEDGDEVTKFQHREQDLRVFAAYAVRPSNRRVRRVTMAHERREDEFWDVRGSVVPVLPEERIASAVLFGYDFRNVDYQKVRGVRTFDRDEDINLGWEWMVEAGPSLQDWNATRDGSVGRLQIKKTFHPAPTHVWFNHLDMDGRYEKGEVQNGALKLRSHYFLSQWIPKNTASLRCEFITSKNLDPERQFLLGGENGLRGYSVRQFSGQHKFLSALENRQDLVYDWLHLMSIGWAVFADAGAAWKTGEGLGWSKVKSDVGLGLRLAPSRSFDPGLIRMDLAYALQHNNKNSRLVLNIGADLMFGERRKTKFEQ